MLQKLSIRNYAIIEALEISFSGRLNIITGETGAGKSILLGALSLILGERADLNALYNKEEKCIIEGHFAINNYQQAYAFLKEQNLDELNPVIIRREISPAGKSRAFINDTPVNLQQLSTFSTMMVDLHQQFDTLQLENADFQLEVIDSLAVQDALLKTYRQHYHQYLTEQKKLAELKANSSEAGKETDYYSFLLQELEEADFQPGELETLEEELNQLSHAEDIKATLSKICYQLDEAEEPLAQQLKQLVSLLESITDFHKKLPELYERLNSAQIELQDIAGEIESINSEVVYDAERIDQINERLALGQKLLKKHSAGTTDELLRIKEKLEDKLENITNIDEQVTAAEKKVAETAQLLKGEAEKISVGRKKQLAPFEKKINELLARVGMPNARIKVSQEKTSLQEKGFDNIIFLFDANKSGKFLPVKKVASGGELSRLMLCIKSLIASSVALPTLIFDEIDTGISGEAARQVGFIMKELGEHHQVICITHQPQIAGRADAHFVVYKEAGAKKVLTNVRLLTDEERISVIAKMLSGDQPTLAAIQNAKELVERH